VVIARAWRFFTNPVARVGAVFAAVIFFYELAWNTTETIEILTYDEAASAGQMITINRHLSLFKFVNSLSPAFIILAVAVIVEYATRISSNAACLRAGRRGPPGQPGEMVQARRLLALPSAVFIWAGLACIIAYVIDTVVFFLSPVQARLLIGWGPVSDVSGVVSWLASSMLLIVLSVIISYMARISVQLRDLAGGGEARL
jgi:hypothetical protein